MDKSNKENPTEDLFDGGIFANVFAELILPPTGHDLHTRVTPFKANGLNIHAGRDQDGHPHLLIPLAEDSEPLAFQLSALTSLTTRTLKNEIGDQVNFLDLTCHSLEGDQLFAAMCFDTCTQIENHGSMPLELARQLISETIEKWRTILEAIAGPSISKVTATGLIGEVLTLLALTKAEGPEALEAWMGQDNARHDFEYEKRALEVKTSTILKAKECHVHGSSQLNSTMGTKLELIHFQIEWAKDGLTIAQVIEELIQLGVAKAKLMQKIAMADFNIDDPENWSRKLSFKVAGCTKFLVDDTFPAVRLPDGGLEVQARVTDLQYRLKLEGLPELAAMKENSTWEDVVNFE